MQLTEEDTFIKIITRFITSFQTPSINNLTSPPIKAKKQDPSLLLKNPNTR